MRTGRSLPVSVDSFSKNVRENVRSLGGGLELRQLYELDDPQQQASDPRVAQAHLELLEEWCTSIEGYLGDTDRSKWETPDSGPDSE